LYLCTHLGTKIGQSVDKKTEIKHRINQTRKAINVVILFGDTKILLKTENYKFIKL